MQEAVCDTYRVCIFWKADIFAFCRYARQKKTTCVNRQRVWQQTMGLSSLRGVEISAHDKTVTMCCRGCRNDTLEHESCFHSPVCASVSASRLAPGNAITVHDARSTRTVEANKVAASAVREIAMSTMYERCNRRLDAQVLVPRVVMVQNCTEV